MYSATGLGGEWSETRGRPVGAALDAWRSRSVSTRCDSGPSRFHFSLLYDIAVSLFSGAGGTFVRLPLSKNNVTSETKCLGWVSQQVQHHLSYCCSCPCAVLKPPPSLPPSAKMNCWQGLIRTGSVTHHPSFIPNHVLLNYSNGANPMHFLIVQYVKSSVMQQCHLS